MGAPAVLGRPKVHYPPLGDSATTSGGSGSKMETCGGNLYTHTPTSLPNRFACIKWRISEFVFFFFGRGEDRKRDEGKLPREPRGLPGCCVGLGVGGQELGEILSNWPGLLNLIRGRTPKPNLSPFAPRAHDQELTLPPPSKALVLLWLKTNL